MLDLAIKARLPIIRVTTDDPVNLQEVLEAVVGGPVHRVVYGRSRLAATQEGAVYWTTTFPENLSDQAVYKQLAEDHATLILVNTEPHPMAFEGGALMPPEEMLHDLVDSCIGTPKADLITRALRGLSMKTATEVLKLTMTQYGKVTPGRVGTIRRRLYPTSTGVQEVNTDVPFYQWQPKLRQWLDHSAPFFKPEAAPILRPRGLLFSGPSGTGKTMGAKAVANYMEIPLMRLDVGTVMSKWAGESERRLTRALDQVEASAPCVMLLDEVEKIFNDTEDSGVTSRLLSELLWWLQEHRSEVLTIMTTNDTTDIPPELFRPGRIDTEIQFEELPAEHAQDFVACYLANVGLSLSNPLDLQTQTKYRQADLVQRALTAVKNELLNPDT